LVTLSWADLSRDISERPKPLVSTLDLMFGEIVSLLSAL
jgi:hypothetical protein